MRAGEGDASHCEVEQDVRCWPLILVRGSGTSVDGTVEVHVCARGYMRLVGWPASVPWRTVR